MRESGINWKGRGLPFLSWRTIQRHFPRTLKNFHFVLLAGFLSLLILRSTIGISNVKIISRDNDPDMGRPEPVVDDPDIHTSTIIAAASSSSTLDLDTEHKRNLEQVKDVSEEEDATGAKTRPIAKKPKVPEALAVGDLHNSRSEDSSSSTGRKIDHDDVAKQISAESVEKPEGIKLGPARQVEQTQQLLEKLLPENKRVSKKKNTATTLRESDELDGEGRPEEDFKGPEAEIIQEENTWGRAESGKALEHSSENGNEQAELEGRSEEKLIDHDEESDGVPSPEEVLSLEHEATANMSLLLSSVEPFSLGPDIGDWDEQRRGWLAANPHMVSSDPHKPKVLLLTGSQPWPCKSQVGDHYLLKMLKNKVDYARIHGLQLFYNFAHLRPAMSHYWAKLPLIREMMLSHPEAEWVFWMDSDAMFTDMVFEIPFEKYAGFDIVMWGYNEGVYTQRLWVACNTGVFFLRNSQWTLDLLDDWVQMGPEGRVRNEAGKILTEFLTGRPEMMADDQSALVFLMLTVPGLRARIHLEWEYWLSGYWQDIVGKYEEFAARSRPGAGGRDWPFTTHFTGCQPCSGKNNPAYVVNSCTDGMERAFNFADNQVLRTMGFEHESLQGTKVRRFRNQTQRPLYRVPSRNTWSVMEHYDERETRTLVEEEV